MRLRTLSILLLLFTWLFGLNDFHNKIVGQQSGNSKNIEGLVILTGSNLRISNGLKIFTQTNAKRLLISGIDRNVSLNDIKNFHFKGSEKLLEVVDLGYGAFSTHSNALETAIWAQNHQFKTIGVVTSRLHMPRSLLVFHQIIPDIEIIPFVVESKNKNIFSILKEFHKFYLTKLIGYFIFNRYNVIL